MSDQTKHDQDEVSEAGNIVIVLRGSGGVGKTSLVTWEAMSTEDQEAVRRALSKASQLPMITPVEPESRHIVATPDVAGGKPRINGHRITVQNIAIWHEHMGKSVDEIATDYSLTLGEVYAALAYYHDHRDEIEASIRNDAAFVEKLKQRQPSQLLEQTKALRDA